MAASAPESRAGFHVAIFCALPLEAECVQATFDQTWKKQYGKVEGDPNAYTFGAIEAHNVVLVHMPDMGKVNAASVAASLRPSFPNIKLGLVVGICGGVPSTPDNDREIILGDVIMSKAVIQYDLGRQYDDGFESKKALAEMLPRPSQEIRAILQRLENAFSREEMQEKLIDHLSTIRAKIPKIRYPGPTADRLYKAQYLHKHRDDQTGDKCASCGSAPQHICADALSKTCDELGCDEAELVPRRRLTEALEKPTAEVSENLRPEIHIGTMGSGDTVMKSGCRRDILAKQDKLIAFEMEGAGTWEHFPNSLIIKGVCDYADSHKKKGWQYCAAATAAACAKAFLNEWPAGGGSSGQEESKSLWYVPFHRSDMQSLVGRKNKLEKIEDILFHHNRRGKVAVLGLGGIGKTRLALEVAYRAKDTRSIFWVQATDTLSFERDYLDIGRLLKIPCIDQGNVDIKEAVQSRLSQDTGEEWLLILDNADDMTLWGKGSAMTKYLPKSPKGSILVTTRSLRVAVPISGNHFIKLDEVTADEGEEMLENLLPESITTDRGDSRLLLEKLTCLPLAIVQAASYINENDISIKDYLRQLDSTQEDDAIELLSEDFNDQQRYPTAINPIAATWLVSFKHIRDHHPLAADYLAFMACLGEKNIPRSLLPAGQKEKDILEAIGTLKGYSFLREQGEGNHRETLYDMHRLVRLATRNWLKKDNSLSKWTERAFRQVATNFPRVNWETRDTWLLYMPHVQVLDNSGFGEDLAKRYDLLLELGQCFKWQGKYGDASETLKRVVRWREASFGVNNEQTMDAYYRYGSLQVRQGNYQEAETILKQAVKWQKENLGDDVSDTLASTYELGKTYFYLGPWNEAEKLLIETLKTSKRVFDVDDEFSLCVTSSLATIIARQGRWKEAEELHRQVLEARERVLGRDQPDTITSISNLALAYERQGRWNEAEKMHLEVLEARERVLGRDQPDTITAMSNLALTYGKQGRWKEAEELHLQELEASERVLGRDHPGKIIAMGKLAFTYGGQGRWKKAEELQLQVLKARERVLGRDHPDTIAAMNNLAFTYGGQGRWKKAEELQLQVLKVSERVLGRDHPDTITAMSNLAGSFYDQGRSEEAIKMLSECIGLRKKVLGTDHPHTVYISKKLQRWQEEMAGRTVHNDTSESSAATSVPVSAIISARDPDSPPSQTSRQVQQMEKTPVRRKLFDKLVRRGHSQKRK